MTRSCDDCVQKWPDWIRLALNAVPYNTGNVLIRKEPFKFPRTLLHGASSSSLHISQFLKIP